MEKFLGTQFISNDQLYNEYNEYQQPTLDVCLELLVYFIYFCNMYRTNQLDCISCP